MILVIISNRNKHKWSVQNNAFVTGYAFTETGQLLTGSSFCEYFSSCNSFSAFRSKASNLNGLYSVILKNSESVYCTSDISRFYPLFYSKFENKLIVSDCPDEIIKNRPVEIDPDAVTEFLGTGICFGKNTLLRNIYQIQSSEIAGLSLKSDEREFTFSYAVEEFSEITGREARDKAEEKIDAAFGRLIQSTEKRQLVLPLSGGYDSRLLAVLLKKYHVKDVVCFTFGRKTKESELSQKVAENLGFKWVFIETRKVYNSDYLGDAGFEEYVSFASKYSSMPYLQEYFAIKYLHEKKIIKENAVFLPGHSGDFLGGSQLKKNGRIKVNSDFKAIVYNYIKNRYLYYPLNTSFKSILIERLSNSVRSYTNQNCIPVTVVDDIDIKEKLSKLIANSANVFSFFGYEARFLFWDLELVNFFKKLPLEYKKNKIFYDDLLQESFFKPYNVVFGNEIRPTSYAFFKQKVKRLLPGLFRYRKPQYQWNYYDVLTEPMKKELEDFGIYNDNSALYNSVITQWYIHRLKKNFTSDED